MVASVTGRNIRLSVWTCRKIQDDHLEFRDRQELTDEIRKAIVDPDYVVAGRRGARIALSWSEAAPVGAKHLAVVYRELNGDGFVITAFFISRFERLLRRGILWQKSS